MNGKVFALLSFLAAVTVWAAPEETSISFVPGWDKSLWQPVRSPRWIHSAEWKQESDGISNIIPGDPGSKFKKHIPGGDYISMLFKKQCSGNTRFETTCMFMERMAPLMVISPDAPAVYGEHIEAVIYDRGINVWHHFIKKDGKPGWKLMGFQAFPLEAEKSTNWWSKCVSAAGEISSASESMNRLLLSHCLRTGKKPTLPESPPAKDTTNSAISKSPL